MLRKQGWRPKRTIVLALWDGEEFGLMGSTEWVEKHEQELERKAAVYINSDSNGRGQLGTGGSGSLETFVKEVLRDVPDPSPGRSLLDARRSDFRLYPLGAGSDYVPFLDHAGIASLNLGFGSADAGGIYHSSYDTMAWYDRFSDGEGVYGKALAQVMATMLIRLPFQFHDLARALRRYMEELPGTPAVDLHEAHSQLSRLYAASRTYDDALASAMKRASLTPEKALRVNEVLEHSERTLLLPDGLPRREWYRHQIYAPGTTTGYGAKTLPGVREAVDAQHWEEANQQARRLTQVLRAMTAQVEEATRLLGQ
jgi:N-acetylated-alpha-linked acidic dipeptidase